MTLVQSLPRAEAGRATVVCLHCSGSSGRQWTPLIQPLLPRFQFFSPDLLGYEEPGAWSIGQSLSLDDEAERLLLLLPDAAPAHLLGHSYGGAVALQMALRWPERIASLTLYEPARFGLLSAPTDNAADDDGNVTEARREIGATAERVRLAVRAGRGDEAAALFADYWGGPGTWATTDPRRRSRQVAAMPKIDAEFSAIFSDRTAPAAYTRLAMPVRLIGGTCSPMPARAVMHRLAVLIPDASTVSLIGLGHMAPITAPQRVRAHLPEWVQRDQAPADPQAPDLANASPRLRGWRQPESRRLA